MKGIWSYKSIWAQTIPDEMVSMGEGQTPLIKARRIGANYGLSQLYFKLETANPSGSYKDRFAAAAVSHLLHHEAKVCLATSSGNTGSALAAYCARAGLPCFVIVVDGTPAAKLEQMQIYGAHTLMVRGFGLDAAITSKVFEQLRALSAEFNTGVQISAYTYSPEGMSGVETIALELAESFNEPSVHVFSPSGGGGLTLAVGQGFLKWKAHDPGYFLPKLHCVQPEGNNTIAGPLRQGENKAVSQTHSRTKVSGLQVPGVIDGDDTIAVCRKLGGTGFLVPDDLVFRLQMQLAEEEGIYCEPAGAVALAGAIRAQQEGLIEAGDRVICLVTGHGFKDNTLYSRMSQGRHHFFDHFENVADYTRDVLDWPIKREWSNGQ